MRNISLGLFATATLLVTGAMAQHEGHTAPPSDKAPPATAEMKCGMMAEHADTAKLVDQLVNGFAAIENEKDATALQAKLAEHGKQLKDLQAQLQGSAQKMETMKGKMMDKGKKQ
jgi:hypothetical protein